MESSIERIGAVECRVKVEIPWADVSPRLDNKLRDLRRRARVPGFRPGKVPPQVIERMFGKSIRDELARDLVQETFQSAVSQHETVPLTQPVLEESSLDKGKPFTYAARFEVPPSIEPKDYEGVAVRRRPAVVDEEKVTAQLTAKQNELIEMRPLPENTDRKVTQALDVWTVDVDGTFGEQHINRKDLQIEIGATTGEFIPGLAKELESLQLSEVGTTKQLEFTPPPERIREDMRGQPVKITLGQREVRVKHIPELDDDFARDTGDAETLVELKKKIADEVREADAEEAEREARRRLVEAILEKNDFEPAPSMVAREVSAQVDMSKRQLAQQGLRLSNIGTTESQLAQRIRPQAVFNVKAYLLLDAIGKKHEIDVPDEEFESELEKMAEESGQNLARMKATMEKNGQLVPMRAQMREEKILDYLMEKAEVTEAPDPEPEPEDGAGGDE